MQTQDTQPRAGNDPGPIPDVLKRTPAPVAATEQPKAKRTRKAKGEAKTPKASKAKQPKHQPSQIERTDANPAKSIVPVRFKTEYAEHGGHCGDRVAEALVKAITVKNEDGRPVLSMVELQKVAEANGIDYTRYTHLNNGQRRMNVGNKLRGLLKAGKPVVIGSQRFKDAEKALTKRPVEAEQVAA